MNVTKTVTTVATIAAGVMIAGFIMNALRDNDIVKSMISGFDS